MRRLGLPMVAILAGLALAMTGAGPAAAATKIRIVASINDLASIAASVGGDLVETTAIARPNADVHRVEALPSAMVRVARAQLYLKVGMDLDRWADLIIDGSHNSELVILDCGLNIQPLEKPTGKVDARLGDVHPAGNPHYWLDPRLGAVVARDVAVALGRLDPAHAQTYQDNAARFADEAEALLPPAAARVAALPSRSIVTYHASWVYFAHAFGLEIVGTVEPVPGIPPTGRHLQELVGLIRERQVPVVLAEPYFSDDAGQFLARQTGVRIAKVSASCDQPVAGSYLAHFDQLVSVVAGGDHP